MDAQVYKYSLRRGVERGTQGICGAYYLLKPWEYRWNTLDPMSFHIYGVLAVRGPDARPYFNFFQTLWPYPKVGMNWSSRASRSVKTLAANILIPFIQELKANLSDKEAQRLALSLALPFAHSFLLTMPDDGGRIPREVIVEWLQDVL